MRRKGGLLSKQRNVLSNNSNFFLPMSTQYFKEQNAKALYFAFSFVVVSNTSYCISENSFENANLHFGIDFPNVMKSTKYNNRGVECNTVAAKALIFGAQICPTFQLSHRPAL